MHRLCDVPNAKSLGEKEVFSARARVAAECADGRAMASRAKRGKVFLDKPKRLGFNLSGWAIGGKRWKN
jgi:hypothetical protein